MFDYVTFDSYELETATIAIMICVINMQMSIFILLYYIMFNYLINV